MNSIFMCGDFHFGLLYKQNIDKWLKIQKDYFYEQFLPILKERYKKGDILIIGGDIFEHRTIINLLVKSTVDELIKELQNIIPTYILVGNHDMYYKSVKNNRINSIQHYEWLPNVTIINEPTTIDFHGQKIVMMPFFDKKEDMIEAINNNQGDYLFAHSDLNGAKSNLNTKIFGDHVEIESFTKYKHVYSSHIHIRQEMKNFTYIGSPYQMTRSDKGTEKGMTIINPFINTSEFIENTKSPIFEKIIIRNEDDISKIENINSENFIDLEIYNSVIVNSRKVRKKIESILEKGGFEKVDYINDLVKKDNINEEKAAIINEKIDFLEIQKDNTTNNYDTVIETYMDYIEFENNEVKNGVKAEFDLIRKRYINIYGNIEK